jgi:peptidoglycan/xylan/chitin deacetylase (PgdA/CDA1 family)
MIKRIITYTLKLIFSNLFCYFGGVYILKYLFRNRPVLVVLNYHNFSCFNNYKIKRGDILKTVNPVLFEKQIIKLKQHFNFTTPEDFFAGKCKNGINLFLTFDDGYRDNFDIAFPFLKKHNIPTAFFISTSTIGTNDYLLHDKVRFLVQRNLLDSEYAKIPLNMYKGNENYSEEFISHINSVFNQNNPNHRLMMNEIEIETLYKSGFIIGNHTHSHIGISFLNVQELENEINTCSNIINNITCQQPTMIAYPNGLFNNGIELFSSHYHFGFTIENGVNYSNSYKLKLKRIGVNVSDTYCIILLKFLLAYESRLIT